MCTIPYALRRVVFSQKEKAENNVQNDNSWQLCKRTNPNTQPATAFALTVVCNEKRKALSSNINLTK